jgi:hypothetical protein
MMRSKRKIRMRCRWLSFSNGGARTQLPMIRWKTRRGISARRLKTSDECHRCGFRPCLDSKFASQIHYAESLFLVTLKCRHIYGVLNIDEIKN